MNIYGAKFVAVYHDFSSDRDDYDYGSEIDLLLTKKFAKKFIAGLKYAHYEGDDNATNALRNPALTQDKTIFWAFLQYKY